MWTVKKRRCRNGFVWRWIESGGRLVVARVGEALAVGVGVGVATAVVVVGVGRRLAASALDGVGGAHR